MKIIAESAFNHNGDVQYLKELAIEAKKAKADYFTAQIYKTEDFCDTEYSKFQICKDVELSVNQWLDFFEHCRKIDLELIPCVLDIPSFRLCYSAGYRFIKIHATDILNIPMLELISSHDCRAILETQCATERDVNTAIQVLGKSVHALFHGFSDYPTKYKDQNLRALDYMRERWPLFKLGFADHTIDTASIPLMALAKEVDYIEKHITLDRSNSNYDWQVSLEPNEFAEMVEIVNEYSIALGNRWKHPCKEEAKYRNIMYKKYLGQGADMKVLRSDNGKDYYEHLLEGYDKGKVIISIIARLKSTRLQRKVVLPFKNDLLLFDLIRRLQTSKKISKTILATSWLEEDRELVDEAQKRNIDVYEGHPLSVIDRMLDLADNEKASAVVRITGDNPFTDPEILDLMVDLYLNHSLDYVRANNLPFGVSAEIFSTSYLYRLYNSMDNPFQTEYLTWFVMLDDSARKGCVDVNSSIPELKRIDYSVDYEADYIRCQKVIARIGKEEFTEITIADILNNTDYTELVDLKQNIKLPEGKSITFEEYFERIDNMNYVIRLPLEVG